MYDRSDEAWPRDATRSVSGEDARGARAGASPPDHGGSELESLAELLTCARDARDAARTLGASAAGMWRSANALVEQQVVERPGVALGVAAGLGFVVAGGLATPAARAVLRVGSRAALGLVLRELILEAQGRGPPPDDDPADT